MNICKNCKNYCDTNLHHPFHQSQGGNGTYVQNLCYGIGSCHESIEKITAQVAQNFFLSNNQINGSIPLLLGSQLINNRWTYQYAQEICGVASGIKFIFNNQLADVKLFNQDATLIGSGQVSRTGSCSAYITGSPHINNPITIISTLWKPLS